jgi:UDPglucose 6-dehydrogenase
MEEEDHDLPPFVLCSDPHDAASGCDAVVLITPWDRMDALDLSRLRSVMRRPVFIDTRNQFDPGAMRTAGFLYAGIGRGALAGAEASGREGGRREPAR